VLLQSEAVASFVLASPPPPPLFCFLYWASDAACSIRALLRREEAAETELRLHC